MAKFKNTYGISKLRIEDVKVKCFCPIGLAVCTYQVYIEVVPNEYIPDYLEVGEMVSKMEGKEYTLESAAAYIYEQMEDYIAPNEILVVVHCDDAKHMPATVYKSSKVED